MERPVGGSSSFATSKTATKRGTLEAQLDQDPELSASRRAEKAQAFEARMHRTGVERKLIAAEETQRELENALRERDITIERLEGDRRWLAEREREEREERQLSEAAWEKERATHTESSRTLRTSLLDLQAKYADLQDAQSTLQRTSTSTIASQKSTIALLERKVAMLDEQLARTQTVSQERAQKLNTLREEVEELQSARDHPASSMMDENWRVIREELQRQSGQLRASETVNARLTAELQKYRTRHESIEVLREEKRTLEKRVMALEQIKDRVAALQGEVDASRKEREEWAAFLDDPSAQPSSNTPTALTQMLTSLRITNADLAEESGSAKALLQHRSDQLTLTETRVKDLSAQCEALQQSAEQSADDAARQERRVKLLEMELQSSNALLATFTAEEAMFGQDEPSYDVQKVERIRDLETLLEEYKATNRELQEQLLSAVERQKDGGKQSGVDEAEVTRRVDEVRAQTDRERETLEENISKLEQKLWEAGAEITLGQRQPAATRVLQLSDNPAAQHFGLRRAELDRLKAENTALLQRLKGSAGGNVVPRESWENLMKEKEDLVESVAQKEKRLLRLKQVFAAKAVEFRSAVSSILGYKLMFQGTQVRLTSVFNMAASILFDSMSKESAGAVDVGTMKVISLGTEQEKAPANMMHLMQFWVHERSSIPCFLAALTLECYEGTTRAQNANAGYGGRDDSAMEMTRG